MRIVEVGTQNYTEVLCMDEPGDGGACHEYEVRPVPAEGATLEHGDNFAVVNFQKGPVKEAGINGCHNEDLIAIVMDRLASFQKGAYACEDNQKAYDHLWSALGCLRHRTQARVDRGVEGTHTV